LTMRESDLWLTAWTAGAYVAFDSYQRPLKSMYQRAWKNIPERMFDGL
jgi:hypothetical protein